MNNPHNLPYFKTRRHNQQAIIALFLRRKFYPYIRKKFPQSYLVQPIPYKNLEYIRKFCKSYPYFLCFDIKLYYPSICPFILLQKLPGVYNKIAQKSPSRRFKYYLKKELPTILSSSPYHKGLGIGSFLSYILTGIFLLELDLEIKNPFLRQVDDYLIFCKNKGEPERLLKNIIIPKLTELNLEINEKKLKSGKFHQDKADFIGLEFYAGYFRIKPEKIEEFKKKIVKITHLTRKKSQQAIIKQLNNKILGFGHYYKFASVKRDFAELDALIRQRFRRWILKNKDQEQRTANLFLTNKDLKNCGLKSLTDILVKYASKKKVILLKSGKKKTKISNHSILADLPNISESIDKIRYYSILKELKQLTKRCCRIERSIAKIAKKMNKA